MSRIGLIKQTVVYLLIIPAIMVIGRTGFCATPENTAIKPTPATTIVAYYFHTTFRCPTCHRIENWSHEAIQESFSDALKDGRLKWRVINIDEPQNRHFIKDYRLFTKSLVIVEEKNGRQVRWKNLNKVWEYVRDQGKFFNYVTSEIKAYLEN